MYVPQKGYGKIWVYSKDLEEAKKIINQRKNI